MNQSEVYSYVAAFCVFLITFFLVACLRLISQKIVQPLAVDIYKKNKEKNPSEEFGATHVAGAWGTLILVASCLGVGIFAAFQPSPPSTSSDATTLAKGYFATQVINCYQMSDFELIANETKCKDALKRMGGY